MEPERIRAVGPYAGSRHRHLHVLRKVGPTPADLPRRPGMAKKRPRGQLVCSVDGRRLRDREPEGRSRQDDDRGQRRRLRRGVGRADPARRPRPPVQRDRRPRRRPRHAALLLRLPDRRASRSPRRPGRPAPTTSGSSPPAATSPAPRSSCRGSRARRRACATASARSASASPTAARLPALARPGQRQRAGRRRPGDRPGPGRVPGARGAGPVPRHAGDDPPRAQPRARRVRAADHHARRAHPPRPGRRARAARALPRDGLRDGDPAQRPRRRGAELWSARDRARSLLARARPPTGRWPRSSPPVASDGLGTVDGR